MYNFHGLQFSYLSIRMSLLPKDVYLKNPENIGGLPLKKIISKYKFASVGASTICN